MNKNFVLKTTVSSVISVAFLLSCPGCVRCCRPTIDVGVSCAKFKMLTWNPVARYPQSPNVTVSGSNIEGGQPYLAEVTVVNNSPVEVRGATVVFAWANFGHFDRGTPIGAVAVDVPPKQEVRVRSPGTLPLSAVGKKHVCLSARVHHPCDSNAANNICFRNFTIVGLPWPWKYFVVPFATDFADADGGVTYRIEAPRGVRARVVRDRLPRGPAEELKAVRAVEKLAVQPGVPQELALVVENMGADFNPGDTFEVKVTALREQREINSFTIQFEVGGQ